MLVLKVRCSTETLSWKTFVETFVRCSTFNFSFLSGTTTKVVTEERMETKKEREKETPSEGPPPQLY